MPDAILLIFLPIVRDQDHDGLPMVNPHPCVRRHSLCLSLAESKLPLVYLDQSQLRNRDQQSYFTSPGKRASVSNAMISFSI